MPIDAWLEISTWLRFSRNIVFISKFVCVINSITAILTTFGSLITIAAIRKTSNRHTPSYVLINELAKSGVIMGLFCQPMFIAFVFHGTKNNTSVYGYLGVTSGFLIVFTASFSSLVMTAISVDRLLAVILRLRYRVVVTVQRVKMFLAAASLVSIIMACLFVTRLRTLLGFSIVFVALVAFFIIVNYLSIIRKLQHHQVQIQIHTQGLPMRSAQANMASNSLRFRQTVRSMMLLCSVFIMCYLPYVINTCTILIAGRHSFNHAGYIVTLSIVFANFSLNPFLYYWKLRDLRKGCWEILNFLKRIPVFL